MPPIRTTPAKVRYASFPDTPEDEDVGFNPAWAAAPQDASRGFGIQTPSRVTVNDMKIQSELKKSPLFPKDERLTDLTQPILSVPDVPVTNQNTSLDWLTATVVYPIAIAYNAVTGLGKAVQWTLSTGISSVSLVRSKLTGNPSKPLRASVQRFDPIGRNRRPRSTPQRNRSTPSRKSLDDKEEDSMFALPPHIVGATPNVVRNAKGKKLRGQAGDTPSAEEARQWGLFHATPLLKRPTAFNFDTPARNSLNDGTPWKTPKFAFDTPQRRAANVKSKKFAMNVHKEEFKKWVRVLQKAGTKTSSLRTDLRDKLEFPTELIISMISRATKTGSADLDTLVKCFTHAGFTTHFGLIPPNIEYPAPAKWSKNKSAININAVTQQADGCCKFCRGASWSGQQEVREIEAGEEVPCNSLHKSVVPYTAEEKAAFAKHKYDLLFRRWCQESRYDWIFETPKVQYHPSKKTDLSAWEIPKDDPRLRHVAMMKQQNIASHDAPKMYNGDLVAYQADLRAKLSKKDIAAKIFIDLIRKENPSLAKIYEKIDLERKRREVQTDWLCVKQVKVIVKGAKKPIPTKSTSSEAKVSMDNSSVDPARGAEEGSPQKKVKRSREVEPSEPSQEINPAKRAKQSDSLALVPVVQEKKRVTFAAEPEGPTRAGNKTPARGILKPSGASTSKLKRPQFNMPPAQPKMLEAPKPSTVSANPTDQMLAQITTKPGNQFLFEYKLPHPSMTQEASTNTTFSKEKSDENSDAPTFFFGASSTNFTTGLLPPSFDPVFLREQRRQEYEKGISASPADIWNDPLTPFGWKPDVTASQEENDAARANYHMTRIRENEEKETRLRQMEWDEELTRNIR